MNFDIQKIRSDFPILNTDINGKRLVYFDNAATTQKPHAVIDAVSEYYKTSNGSINRSGHELALRATYVYDDCKKELLKFLGADNKYDLYFVKNATEGINSLAWGLFYQKYIQNRPAQKGIILTTEQEHHANLLPWIWLSNDFGIDLQTIPVTPEGSLNYEEFINRIEKHQGSIELITLTQISNVVGEMNNVKLIIDTAKKYDIPVLIDAAQSVGHMPINLAELSPTFFVASGHKMYGPAGVGFVILEKSLVERLEPLLLGGGMVSKSTTNSFISMPGIDKFNAGTLNGEGIAGLLAAIRYLQQVDIQNIHNYEQTLSAHFAQRASNVDGLSYLGNKDLTKRAGLFSLTHSLHPHDIADYLDEHGIAVRAGHHCAHPLHQILKLNATARVSFGMYNTIQEIDYFFDVLADFFKQMNV
jgi:cysteine desulfurase/selenocysteine lyase